MIQITNCDFQETQKCSRKLFVDVNNLDFTIPNQESNVLQQQQINAVVTELKNNTLYIMNNLQDQFMQLQVTFVNITQLLRENLTRLNEIIHSLESSVLEDNLLSQIEECCNYQKNEGLISPENKFGQGLTLKINCYFILSKAFNFLNALESLNNDQLFYSEHNKYSSILKKEIELKFNCNDLKEYQTIKIGKRLILFWNKKLSKFRTYFPIFNILIVNHHLIQACHYM